MQPEKITSRETTRHGIQICTRQCLKLIVCCLLSFTWLTSQAVSLPKQCQLIGLASEKLILASRKTHLFFIHNIGDTDLYLSYLPENDPGAQAGWTSRINQDKWSVIKLNHGKLTFECVEVKPGHEQQITCQGVLSVCKLEPQETPKHDNGNYWVGENTRLPKLLQTVSSRGFQLPMTEE